MDQHPIRSILRRRTMNVGSRGITGQIRESVSGPPFHVQGQNVIDRVKNDSTTTLASAPGPVGGDVSLDPSSPIPPIPCRLKLMMEAVDQLAVANKQINIEVFFMGRWVKLELKCARTTGGL